ncbi:MAG: hypothetical protein IAC58_00230 [Firmicutes bacterium]|uniref:Uncharacterized protein n=1 Tax=Candidatus Onthovivens merdipullorum TaxID=2840889 RepID=A0A9D9DG76_9BACL|nr:hypothetical protein [Candidatus Onthovivens merdipullorum]
MSTELELKQTEEKIQETRNELNRLNAVANDLRVKLYYEKKGLKPRQPFMCKGKKIFKVSCATYRFFNGFYLTKKGELTAKPISFCIDDEITPLPIE